MDDVGRWACPVSLVVVMYGIMGYVREPTKGCLPIVSCLRVVNPWRVGWVRSCISLSLRLSSIR